MRNERSGVFTRDSTRSERIAVEAIVLVNDAVRFDSRPLFAGGEGGQTDGGSVRGDSALNTSAGSQGFWRTAERR